MEQARPVFEATVGSIASDFFKISPSTTATFCSLTLLLWSAYDGFRGDNLVLESPLGLAQRHRQRRGDERQRHGHGGAPPDYTRRHQRHFPDYQAVEGIERPGGRIGDHLRRTSARLERGGADGKADYRTTRSQRAAEGSDRDTEKARLWAQPRRDPFIGQCLGDEASADHAGADARQQADELDDAIARAVVEQHTPAIGRDHSEYADHQPEEDVDGERHLAMSVRARRGRRAPQPKRRRG